MKSRFGLAIFTCICLVYLTGAADAADGASPSLKASLKGPYLGQTPPGDIPQPFAVDFIKPPEGFHSSVVFSPDGTEALWTDMRGTSYYTHIVNDLWTEPVQFAIADESDIGEPFFSIDGSRLYFLSRRQPGNDAANRERIWFAERQTSGWSEPKLIDSVVARHPTHWEFSFSDNGNLYFASELGDSRNICFAEKNGDSFLEPVALGENINGPLREFCPFIASDESYLIFSRSVPEENNRSDLFISFKDSGGHWREAINMGDTINTLHNDVCPVVTRDGKYLFYLQVSGKVNQVCWVSASVIERLRGEQAGH